MNRTDRAPRRAFVLPLLLVVAGVTAVNATACNGSVSQLAPYEPPDGVGGTALDGGSYVTTGGETGYPLATGGTYMTPPKPTEHRSDHGEGGASATWEVPTWLQERTQCEPTQTAPTELASTPESDCTFFEISLPGVMEYSVDPSAFDLDEWGQGWFLYEGCDDVGSPCVGRVEYEWDVEYLTDNEWNVSLSPVHTACDYDHVTLHEGPTGELEPKGTYAWAPCELTVHLQPTVEGLTIGAVRSGTDEPIEVGTCIYVEGWSDDEIRSLMVDALVEHLQSLEWECLH